MKKIITLLCVFILCGCTNNLNKTDLNVIESNVIDIAANSQTHANVGGKGFKFYKPRDFSVLEDDNYNIVLLHEATKYYLTVDVNSYHNKTLLSYEKKPNLYYNLKFKYKDLDGYIEIRDGNNSYFYIKMMYNYSYIEVSVMEEEINDAIIDSMIILSSIEYNDKIIDSLITSGDLDSRSVPYEIKKPKETKEGRNILDVYEYDMYSEAK